MVFFLHMILLDDRTGLSMCLGETAIVTEGVFSKNTASPSVVFPVTSFNPEKTRKDKLMPSDLVRLVPWSRNGWVYQYRQRSASDDQRFMER